MNPYVWDVGGVFALIVALWGVAFWVTRKLRQEQRPLFHPLDQLPPPHRMHGANLKLPDEDLRRAQLCADLGGVAARPLGAREKALQNLMWV